MALDDTCIHGLNSSDAKRKLKDGLNFKLEFHFLISISLQIKKLSFYTFNIT